MSRFLYVLIFMVILIQPALAENWYAINDDWFADKDTILKTRDSYIVMLHNVKRGIYYYNEYSISEAEKYVRQQKIKNIVTHYPYGKNPIPFDEEDFIIYNAITNPLYVYVPEKKQIEKTTKDSFVCIELRYEISKHKHSTSMLEYFYIDSNKKNVMNHLKHPVSAVEEFNDEIIKFVTIKSSNHPDFNIVTYYTLNRYTGNIHVLQQSSPANKVGKFSRALSTGVYDITIGEATGTAKKIDRPSQQF